MVISGESGCGKSWRTYGICEQEQSSERLCVIVDARDHIDMTLERAARIVWQEIAGHDQTIPLVQIGRRLKQIFPDIKFPWLTLIIEGTVSINQVSEITRENWDDWGVRIVLSMQLDASRNLENSSQGRIIVEAIDDFTERELQEYLGSILGDSWPSMPSFIRSPLRKPLIAALYREIVDSHKASEWIPETEYQLFQAFWNKLDNPIDCSCLIKLAEQAINIGNAAWKIDEITEVSRDSQSVFRLESIGWLRRNTSNILPIFEFSHNRLLNWACAMALISTLSSNNQSKIITQLNQYLWVRPGQSNRLLNFVPMDFLWLTCNQPGIQADIPAIIDGLTSKNFLENRLFYEKLLPTLGESVLDPLVVQLKRYIQNPEMTRSIVKAIVLIGGTKAVEIAQILLQDDQPLIQIAAANILSVCPIGDALNDLWRLHNESQAEHDRFLRDREQGHSYSLYEKTFDALKKCCLENPDWIGETIQTADPENNRMFDLAYLLSHIPGEVGKRLWLENKQRLFDSVPESKRRALARCIDVFSDLEELDWIESNVSVETDLLGTVALQALARLAPERAIQQLSQIDWTKFQFYPTWFIQQLLVTHLTATRAKILSMMEQSENVWPIARFYNNRFNYADTGVVGVLISHLSRELQRYFGGPERDGEVFFYHRFGLLSQNNTIEQIDFLTGYSDSEFERLLLEYVIQIGPRQGSGTDSLSRQEAIDILFRIGGDGFSAAVNCLLRADNRYGRLDGLELAKMGSNQETIECLTQICEQAETWNGYYYEQTKAAEILVFANVWEPVLLLIKRNGLPLSNELFELPLNGNRPSEQVISRIIDLQNIVPSELSVGDILVLGFGTEDHAKILTSLTSHYDSESDHAKACVMALSMLEDSNVDNIEFLGTQLHVPDHCHLAKIALLVNGTERAAAVILDFEGDSIDVFTAVDWIMKLEDKTELIEKTKQALINSIQNKPEWKALEDLSCVIKNIKNEQILSQLLLDEQIDEFLRNGAFADDDDISGQTSKSFWIRCYGALNKKTAMVAAKAAFKNLQTRDRDHYPSLLLELDEGNAVSILFDAVKTEEDEKVRSSIGRALASVSIKDLLIKELNSEDSTRQVTACYLSRWQSPSSDLEEMLVKCVSGLDQKVSQEAVNALDSLSIQREVNLLGEAFLHTDIDSKRWLLLECMLELCDEGDEFHVWPLHVPTLWGELNSLQRNYCQNILKKKRKG